MKKPIYICNNLEEWEQRKSLLKSNISKKTGIDFNKPAKPAACTETKINKINDCVIKNVYWQTLDDYYVAGNIFLPAEIENPIPAVMLPHGHFELDRFNLNSTLLALSLAKLGCMVATYDMVGKGEDKKTPHDHKYNNAIQLHNSIRILDYICSLDYIDKTRIAVTGASGGGSQTMMLASMDNRIKAAIPVCMLSAHFNGGCLCESGLNYFEGEGFKTNNAEIAAMIAPRDMLVISIGTDWTKNTPKVEFPFLQSVYRLYQAEDKVKTAHFAKEEHDYGDSKMKAAVQFLCGIFELDFSKYDNAAGAAVSMDDLRSYRSGFEKPANALSDPELIYKEILAYYK